MYLYQRWIYRVDATRTNEFGYSLAAEEEAKKKKEAEAAAAAAALQVCCRRRRRRCCCWPAWGEEPVPARPPLARLGRRPCCFTCRQQRRPAMPLHVHRQSCRR
jgi:hypothetical protein